MVQGAKALGLLNLIARGHARHDGSSLCMLLM
jgi:hypothetical protein